MYAQFVAPHVCHRQGEIAIPRASRGIQQVDRWKHRAVRQFQLAITVAISPSCIRQFLARPHDVVPKSGGRRVSRHTVWRHQCVCHWFAHTDHTFSKRALINGKCKGTPHTRVRKRIEAAAYKRGATVETVEIRAEIRHNMHVAALASHWFRQRRERLINTCSSCTESVKLGAVMLHIARRLLRQFHFVSNADIGHPISAASIKCQHGGVVVLNGQDVNAVDRL